MTILKYPVTLLVFLALLVVSSGKVWSEEAAPSVYYWGNPLTGASVPLDKDWQIMINNVIAPEDALIDFTFYNAEQNATITLSAIEMALSKGKDQSSLFDRLVKTQTDYYDMAEQKYNGRGRSSTMRVIHDIITVENTNIGLTQLTLERADARANNHGFMFYFIDDNNRSWSVGYENKHDDSLELALQNVTPFIRSVVGSNIPTSHDLPTFIPGMYSGRDIYPPAQFVVEHIFQNNTQALYQWQNPFTKHIIPVEAGWQQLSASDNTDCANRGRIDSVEIYCFYHQPSGTRLILKRRAPQALIPYGMMMIDYRNQGAETTAQDEALSYSVSMHPFDPYQLPLLQYSDKATGKPKSYKISFDTLKTMWEIKVTTNLDIQDWRLSNMITLLFASTQEESDIDPQEWANLQPLPVVENTPHKKHIR